MNVKPGTPFIYFAIVAPLVVTGAIAFDPLAGTPFDISAQLVTIIIVSIQLDFLIIAGFLNSFFDRIPVWLQWLNPILILCHFCILAGGVALNRGKSKLGSRLVASACAVIIMFVAFGYFVPIAAQDTGWADFPDVRHRTVTFDLIAPMFYLVSVLVAMYRATYLLGANRSPSGVQ